MDTEKEEKKNISLSGYMYISYMAVYIKRIQKEMP